MGNLGSRKKQKDEEVTDDVWLKLNDGQPSPKEKKKKKKEKKKKKKKKGDSPDKNDEDVSQCDSYSYSTLSSRRLSDSTIASTGTLTHQKPVTEQKSNTDYSACNNDDQSNCSIGYVTASDTFTPPSPRKGRPPKFSPVIAQDSPRVVRRLLQSDKINENIEKPPDLLSPRAKFFLSTPEPNKSSNVKTFEHRKYNRHSSGSSIDSRTFLSVPDDKITKTCVVSENDTRCITNGSLLVKSRQHENKNSSGFDSRLSNNSLEMSDSTTENLLKTGEKAKLIRYDGGNMSPAQRRKNKQIESLIQEKNIKRSDFIKCNDTQHKQECSDITTISEQLPKVQIISSEGSQISNNNGENQNVNLNKQNSYSEIVPPPTPTSGVNIVEADEHEIECESCPEKCLSKDDEIFGDSVCKRLSLLLESEQDHGKLNRSEFSEFTDSQCSSPEVTDIVSNDQTNFMSQQIINYEELQPQIVSSEQNQNFRVMSSLSNSTKEERRGFENTEFLERDTDTNDQSKLDSTVKTPQGQDNASVLDVMNNNFRIKAVEDNMVQETNKTENCAQTFENQSDLFRKKYMLKQEEDIDEQMRYENSINEKLIEEKFRTLSEILPLQGETNKRSSVLFAVNNKHANDPDNYILVTKKTYCVKRGVLVELDEEKDVLTQDAIKVIDKNSEWITTGSEKKYTPDAMLVEQGSKLLCPTQKHTDYYNQPICDSEPDYVNMDDFEELEREFNRISHSDGEIDFENVLNRSQSQSDSDSSEIRPKRESEILCDVISAYRDHDYSDRSNELSENDEQYNEQRRILNRKRLSRHLDYSSDSSEEVRRHVKEPRFQNLSAHDDEYSDEFSDDEILYVDEPKTSSEKFTPKVVRVSSKLDQSLQKIFQEKAKQIALAKQQIVQEDKFESSSTTELYNQCDEGAYNGAYPMDYTGRRRSLTYTESDIDASEPEKWEDDDASNDSMLADDEDDDDESGEIIFSKPYIEHDQKMGAMLSYNMVKTLPDSPVIWAPEPEPEDDDVFQDTPYDMNSYQYDDESLYSSDEAFGDARKQMQEIHEQLQTLREQMGTFEKEEGESSLPTSPADDRTLHIQKADTD